MTSRGYFKYDQNFKIFSYDYFIESFSESDKFLVTNNLYQISNANKP